MTDSKHGSPQNNTDVEKLPTAAYLKQIIDERSGNPSYQTSQVRKPRGEQGDWEIKELVRRKDVIEREIERINQIDEGIREAIEKTDRDVPYFVYNQLKQHKKKLQEELEEVQNQ